MLPSSPSPPGVNSLVRRSVARGIPERKQMQSGQSRPLAGLRRADTVRHEYQMPPVSVEPSVHRPARSVCSLFRALKD